MPPEIDDMDRAPGGKKIAFAAYNLRKDSDIWLAGHRSKVTSTSGFAPAWTH